MNKTPLTVFLCSTYGDLTAERDAVLQAVRKLQLQHDSMEFFGARHSLAIETCLEEVRRSDVLIVIVGFKYGSLVPERSVSFTEAEYSEGYRLGKTSLVYLRNENVPILPAHIERDPAKFEALERFKATLQERHTVAGFKDANDLAVSVAADLSRTVQAIEEAAKAKKEGEKEPRPPIFNHVSSMVGDTPNKNISEDTLFNAIDKRLLGIQEHLRKLENENLEAKKVTAELLKVITRLEQSLEALSHKTGEDSNEQQQILKEADYIRSAVRESTPQPVSIWSVRLNLLKVRASDLELQDSFIKQARLMLVNMTNSLYSLNRSDDNSVQEIIVNRIAQLKKADAALEERLNQLGVQREQINHELSGVERMIKENIKESFKHFG